MSFENDFPKLKFSYYTQKMIKDRTFTTNTLFVRYVDIKKFCLDKQKVREAIKKARISSMTHKCPKCHELVWTTTREEVVSYIVLLRELCLDDEVKE